MRSPVGLPLLSLRGGDADARVHGGALVRPPPADSLASPAEPLLTAASSNALQAFWSEHGKLITIIGGALVLLSPVLRSLPRPAALTASVMTVALVQMAFDVPPDLVLLEAVVALVGLKVITMKDALKGFSSEGVVSVGVMTAVAKSVQLTGGLQLISKYLLGMPRGYEMAQLRLVIATMLISAFMNNTPVCAMLMPIVHAWSASLGLSAASLLMPLSFATMLGGTLSMIGSSTNLVAANAASLHDPTFSMKVFDISGIGAVNALAGTAYMLVAGRHLLPMPPVTKVAAADAAKAPAAAPPPRGTARLWITLVLIAITMTVASQAPAALLPMALGCLCVLVRLGCMTLKEAWTAVNGPVLLSIALSFALGEAIKKSDLASIVAGSIVSVVAPYGNLALLFAIYFVAILIGAVISNNAVVALMFPIVVRICEQAGVSWKPALYALTLAASASFSTPVSYQTNLMVAADAGYSFGDFLKFGVPLQLVCMLATVPACMVLAK